MRRGKIVATLGPAVADPIVLEKLIDAGVNMARINMSHANQEANGKLLVAAREAAQKLDHPLAILVDLSGPKIRTGKLENGEPVRLEEGATFRITSRPIIGTKDEVSTNYPEIIKAVTPGTAVLIEDGAMELDVQEVTATDLICTVVHGGILGEMKGINLPGALLPIPALTAKDKQDLVWAVEQKAEYIALSFVRSANDCKLAKSLIKDAGGDAKLIAKIEKSEAIENLDGIIAEADGVMVARGDLGVETSVEMVPVYQKQIIERANIAGKIVITATQMLQSMITQAHPTRAEASDVANAIWDGTDAVMLSNETAVGKNAVAAVTVMGKIIEQAELGRPAARPARDNWFGQKTGDIGRALTQAATLAAEQLTSDTIVVFSQTGTSARRLSAVRPHQRIIAMTSSTEVANSLAPVWGLESLIHPEGTDTEKLIGYLDNVLLEKGIATKGENIVIMAGRYSGLGLSRSIKIFEVGSSQSQKTDD